MEPTSARKPLSETIARDPNSIQRDKASDTKCGVLLSPGQALECVDDDPVRRRPSANKTYGSVYWLEKSQDIHSKPDIPMRPGT